jgi:hypothetical protein
LTTETCQATPESAGEAALLTTELLLKTSQTGLAEK